MSQSSAMSTARAVLRPIARDVRRRQGLAIAASVGLGQWMIRSFPPWDLRDAAYFATPEQRAPYLAGALVLVVVVSRALVRRLLCSRDARHLRHLPIRARTWRWLHGTQLLALDLPIVAAATYGVWPTLQRARTRWEGLAWVLATIAGLFAARVLQCAMIDRRLVARLLVGLLPISAVFGLLVVCDAWFAAGLAVGAAIVAVHRLGRPFPEPRVRTSTRVPPLPHPVLARAWVQLLGTCHRDRVHLVSSLATQAVVVALGTLAALHLHASAPADARWAVQLAACTSAAMALWGAVRSERALLDDRWMLDPFVGARTVDLGGRMLAAAALATPLFAATLVALRSHPLPGVAITGALAAIAWTAGVSVELVTRAELRRALRRPQTSAIAVRVAIGVVAALLLGPLGLIVQALVSTVLAARRWSQADLVRRRFARLPGELEAAAA